MYSENITIYIKVKEYFLNRLNDSENSSAEKTGSVKRMRNLQKMIRYGIFLTVGILGICGGIILGRAEKVNAEPQTDALTHPSEIMQMPGNYTASEAPQNPEETTAAPAPDTVTEAVTEKWTIISGKRLELILKYMGDEVNFEKDGISLKITGPVAKSWNVKENQTVQSLVQKTSDQSYEVKIYKGAQEITDITGSEVVLPVKEVFPDVAPETIEVTDPDGEKADTTLDEDQKLLTVRTDRTGMYHVRGRKTEIRQKPYAVAAMVAATALIVGLRTRSEKRGDRDRKEE